MGVTIPFPRSNFCFAKFEYIQFLYSPISKMVNTSVYTLCRRPTLRLKVRVIHRLSPAPAIADVLDPVRKDTPKHKACGKVDRSTPDRKSRSCRKPTNPMKEFESILRSLMLYPIMESV